MASHPPLPSEPWSLLFVLRLIIRYRFEERIRLLGHNAVAQRPKSLNAVLHAFGDSRGCGFSNPRVHRFKALSLPISERHFGPQ